MRLRTGVAWVAALAGAAWAQENPVGRDPAAVEIGRGIFRIYCAPCHGIRAQGGRGPDLSRGVFRAGDKDGDLFRVIADGLAGTEMAGFREHMPDESIWRIVAFLRTAAQPGKPAAPAGDAGRGSALYWGKGQCGNCHVVGGRGRAIGPDLTMAGRSRSIEYLRESVVSPNADVTPGYSTVVVVTRDGQTVTGVERQFDNFSCRLLDLSGKTHSFQKEEVTSMRREPRSVMPDTYQKVFQPGEIDDLVAYLASLNGSVRKTEMPAAASGIADSPGNWITYGKNHAGWRYSPLDQVNTTNVARLAPVWVFQTHVGGGIETTPLVYDGVMYLTGPSNHGWALDARTGAQLWQYSKTPPKGLDLCCGEVNRGFGTLGNRLFKVNIEDTLVSLDAASGAVIWETLIADYKKGYSGTVAPLVVRDKVLVGTAGAEFGIRGFVDAYSAATGERLWRFYTVAAKGEPGGDTWGADSWMRGGGSTWITGTYDPELNLTYWGTGNPGPDMNGDLRPGDNLYTCSVVALDADTGKLKWHFQFTPHDVHDWDAISDPVLVDLNIAGRKVPALIQANRNGHFYALDRRNGKLLAAKSYTTVTWTKGIGADGRPVLVPGLDPSEEGTTACPGLGGGHNWQATAYSPRTGLYYFGSTDGCQVYYKTNHAFVEGQWFQLSTADSVRGSPASGSVVAVDPASGGVRWRYGMVHAPSGGMLATAGGLVFTGDGFGYVIALDARTGAPVWRFAAGGGVSAPAVTYAVDGRQYVAVAAGGTVIAFGVR